MTPGLYQKLKYEKKPQALKNKTAQKENKNRT